MQAGREGRQRGAFIRGEGGKRGRVNNAQGKRRLGQKKRKLLLTSSAFPNFFGGKGIQINEGFS